MKVKINYNNKKITVGNVVECKSFFSKLKGLMFKKSPKALLFVFNGPTKMAIHSFFVKTNFLAIWIKEGKVVDIKIVKPWRVAVRSNHEFDMLLEIPFKGVEVIKPFLDGS